MARVRRSRRRGPARRLPLLADAALAVALLAALALVVARGLWEPPQTLGGSAAVVDGDTLMVGNERVRLAAIDAPELSQTCTRDGRQTACGRDARVALQRLVAGGSIACRWSERDRYGRLLGHCEAGGTDLNREMVRSGWAVAYGDYHAVEREARLAARGVWAGEFEQPQDWRRLHGGLAEQEHRVATLAWLSTYIWTWFD